MSGEQTSRILVFDDQKPVAENIAVALSAHGYSVCTAGCGREALLRLKDTPLQLVISDLTMPQMSGFELISAIRWRFPNMPVIAMSGTYTADGVPRAVDAFYAKGKHSLDQLVSAVDELLSAHHGSARQDSSGRAHLVRLTGESRHERQT
jgi:DNA-binding NtrC family response regulator